MLAVIESLRGRYLKLHGGRCRREAINGRVDPFEIQRHSGREAKGRVQPVNRRRIPLITAAFITPLGQHSKIQTYKHI